MFPCSSGRLSREEEEGERETRNWSGVTDTRRIIIILITIHLKHMIKFHFNLNPSCCLSMLSPPFDGGTRCRPHFPCSSNQVLLVLILKHHKVRRTCCFHPSQLLPESHRGGHRGPSVEESRPHPGVAGGFGGGEVLREDRSVLRQHTGIRGERAVRR